MADQAEDQDRAAAAAEEEETGGEGVHPRGTRKRNAAQQQPQQEEAEEEDQPPHDAEDHNEEGAAAPSKRAADMTKLPGFSMPPSITVWSDPMAPVVLADYLRLQKLTLKLGQSPPVEEWTCYTKPAITCNHCGVTSTTTSISSLQQGRGISCVCSGRDSLKERWYYERAIAQPFEDRNGRVRYARLHDGRLAKPSWEEWLAAADRGNKGKLRLTCLHCGVTSTTTSINSLQKGRGIACQCAKKRA
jgi:DNA-directed RNA polymerase subunit RPC12/RpoP